MWAIIDYLRTKGDNFGKVDEGIYRGARPKDYNKLKALGITTIINLKDGSQFKEMTKSDKAGIRTWYHIPMFDNEAPTDAAVEKFFAILNNKKPEEKIFIHCEGGRHRTGVMIAAHRILVHDWTYEEAYKEMKKYGWFDKLFFGSNNHRPLKEWLIEYIKVRGYKQT